MLHLKKKTFLEFLIPNFASAFHRSYSISLLVCSLSDGFSQTELSEFFLCRVRESLLLAAPLHVKVVWQVEVNCMPKTLNFVEISGRFWEVEWMELMEILEIHPKLYVKYFQNFLMLTSNLVSI